MKKKKKLEDKKNWFKNKNELIVFLISFIIALVFFLWQRHIFSWDFSVYMMNAEYILRYGNYFEWLRAPLVPLILMIFRLLGRTFASYAFVIFCCCFYFFSLKLFHDKFLNQNKFLNLQHSEIFYLFAINPFILNYGLRAGSELISFSLITLFIVFAFSISSFFFLGLSMLARYSNFVLLPLLFFSKNIKKIIFGVLIIFLLFIPWFIFNYTATGYFLTSIGDYYALNSLEQPLPKPEIPKLFFHLLLVTNVSLPFLIIGIIKKIKKTKKTKKEVKIKQTNRQLIVLLSGLAILTLLMYEFNSIKEPRFLMNISLFVFYFSVLGFDYLIEKSKNKRILILIFLTIFLIASFSSFLLAENYKIDILRENKMVEEIIEKMNSSSNNCLISSDLWIYFNWKNKMAVPPPSAVMFIEGKRTEIFEMIDEGYNLIFFKNSEAFEKNKKFIDELETYIFEDNENYVWLYNFENCKNIEKFDKTFIDSMKKIGEFDKNFNGCKALFLRFNIKKLCDKFKFL